MAKRIVVVGGGPGGYAAALRSAQMGALVTLIERDHLGGTCLNRGCIPSKILKEAAHTLHRFQQAETLGIRVAGSVTPDMGLIMARKGAIVSDQIKGLERLLAQRRVEVIHGHAVLEGKGRALVTGNGGLPVEAFWDSLILATGSRPRALAQFPFDGHILLSSDHALELPHVPQNLLIVGGGVIGCEFASIFASLGATVTLVEAMDRLLPLPSVDPFCSKWLQREMKKQKIRLLLNQTVQDLLVQGGTCMARLGPSPFVEDKRPAPSQVLTVPADKILVCIGRDPRSESLGLESIGVLTDEKGWIKADRRLCTTAPEVYAIGDCLGPSRPMYAYVATEEGMAAAENALGGNHAMDYRAVPGAVFTTPEVAGVGLTEPQLREQGIPYRGDSVLFRNVGKSHVLGEISGEARILTRVPDGVVLGVHMVGPGVTELMGEPALAVRLGSSVEDLAAIPRPHPTLSEIMSELSYKALDRPLHG